MRIQSNEGSSSSSRFWRQVASCEPPIFQNSLFSGTNWSNSGTCMYHGLKTGPPMKGEVMRSCPSPQVPHPRSMAVPYQRFSKRLLFPCEIRSLEQTLRGTSPCNQRVPLCKIFNGIVARRFMGTSPFVRDFRACPIIREVARSKSGKIFRPATGQISLADFESKVNAGVGERNSLLGFW